MEKSGQVLFAGGGPAEQMTFVRGYQTPGESLSQVTTASTRLRRRARPTRLYPRFDVLHRCI